MGPKGHYRLSNYQSSSIPVSHFAIFLITCVGDIVDFIATQGFKPDTPYPDGLYTCDLRYLFPSGAWANFHLSLKKVDAALPGWAMTFADIADDLEALCYAALWFEGRPGGVPHFDVDVLRFKNGLTGPTVVISKGSFAFDVMVSGNGSSSNES